MVETEAEHGEDGGHNEVVVLLIDVRGSMGKEAPSLESAGERLCAASYSVNEAEAW
jgi:hypothetical protein